MVLRGFFLIAVLVLIQPNLFSQNPGSDQCLDFGGDDFVNINAVAGTMAGMENSFTVEFWVNTPNIYTAVTMASVFGVNTAAGGNTFIMFAGDNVVGAAGDNRIGIFDGGSAAFEITGGIVSDNNWHHVAYVNSAATGTLYLDGISQGTHTSNFTFIATDQWSIGQEFDAGANSDFITGNVDEVRVWNTDIAEANIRDFMCKKVTAAHPNFANLQGYYALDDGAGVVATESINAFNGALITGGGVFDWINSGAPIGDISSFDYGNGDATSVNVIHTDGDDLTINGFSGIPDGAHVYVVTEAPNTVAPPAGFASLEGTRYYGAFVVNGTSPTFNCSYDYTGNANIDGVGNETEARWVQRDDGADLTWTPVSGLLQTNITTDIITNRLNEGNQFEFIAGFKTTAYPTPPGSGSALDFDGLTQNVSVPDDNSLDMSASITLEAWINPDDVTAGQGSVISKFFADADATSSFQLFKTAGTGQFNVSINESDLNTVTVTSGATTANSDEWMHIAATADGANINLYINGVLVGGPTAYDGTILQTTRDVFIGRMRTEDNTAAFDAMIDEVRIFNTALTQAQIRTWMCRKVTSTHPAFANMVSYYRFDDGAGLVLEDIVDVNDGVINNGAVFVTSGAALGDDSGNDYSGAASTINLSHANGDDITVNSFSGTVTGAHLYLVNEAPNVVAVPTNFASLESTRYWGVFTVGTGVRFNATYAYGGNVNITGSADEVRVRFVRRDDNAGAAWAPAAGTLSEDASGNSLESNSQGQGELMAAFRSANYPTGPGPVNSLDFDGFDDHVLCANNPQQFLSSTFSIEAWVRPATGYGTEAAGHIDIVSKWGAAGAGNAAYLLGVNSVGIIQAYLHDGAATTTLTSLSAIPENEWSHICITRSAANVLTIYINGVADNNDPAAVIPQESNYDLFIGQEPIGGNNFEGLIDEVRIWNTELSVAQLRDFMCKKINILHPVLNNLMANYRFDEASGSATLEDFSGGNDGVLTNMTIAADWVTSSAPIGFRSNSDYGAGNGTSVNLAHPVNGDDVTINGFSGVPDGAHVYLIQQPPNSVVVPTGYASLETTRYWGTFVTGGTNPAYSLTYDYTGYGVIDGIGNESEIRMVKRDDNADATWYSGNGEFNTNTGAKTVTIPNLEREQNEFIGAFRTASYPTPPGSGNALLFDGINDFVQIPFDESLEFADGTFECWIRPDWVSGSNGYNPCVMALRNVADTRYSIHIRDNYSNVDIWDGIAVSSLPFAFTQGQWYHIAVSESGASATVYVNGVSIGVTANDINTANTDRPLFIGSSDGTAEFFTGVIEEVKIFNTSVSQANIRDYMCEKLTSAHPDYANLVAYYRFDQIAGSTYLEDLFGGNDGVLTNMAVATAWITSAAPIGDDSSDDYAALTPSLAHADGDQMDVSNVSGVPSGVHLYRIDEAPNSVVVPTGYGSLETTRYWGVFFAGGTSPQFDITYSYAGNAAITAGNENTVRLVKRDDNTDASWVSASGTLNTNTTANTILSESQERSEFMAGFRTAAYPTPAGAGNAIVYDGVNDLVDIVHDNTLNSTATITVEAWINTTAVGTQFILAKNTDSYQMAVSQTTAGMFGFALTGVNGGAFLEGTTAVNDGEWHHVAGTYDGATMRVYVDGVNENSVGSVAAIGTGTNNLTFGARAGADLFTGTIDEIRIWSTEQSQANLRDFMCEKLTSAHPDYTNLISYYRKDETAGTVMEDLKAGNDGTLTGGPSIATSGAFIGDDSDHNYGGAATTVTFLPGDGSSFNINGFDAGDPPTGAHVYMVTGTPNTTSEDLNGTPVSDLELTRYFGIFLVGGTNPNHALTYVYTGTAMDGHANESEAVLSFRNDNSEEPPGTVPSWRKLTFAADLTVATNTITKCRQTGNKEIIVGFDDGTGGSPVTVTWENYTGDLDWNNGCNWEDGNRPKDNDNIVFPAGVLMPSPLTTPVVALTVTDFTMNSTLGDLVLTADLVVTNSITLTSGLIDIQTFNLVIQSGATIAGGGVGSYVEVDGGGSLRQEYAAGPTPAGVVTFPVGDDDDFTPFTLEMNSIAVLGANPFIDLSVTDAVPSIVPQGAFNPDRLSRFWTITSNDMTTPNYDFTGTYVDADIVGAEASIISKKAELAAGTVTDFLNVNAGTNQIQGNGATDFSIFFGSGACPGATCLVSVAAGPADWNVAATWIPAAIPCAACSAVVQTGHNVFVGATPATSVGSVETEAAAGALEIDPGAALTIEDQIHCDGTMTIESTVAGDGYWLFNGNPSDPDGAGAEIDGTTGAGTITIQRFFSQGAGYRQFASPWSTMPRTEFADDMDNAVIVGDPYIGDDLENTVAVGVFPNFYVYSETSTNLDFHIGWNEGINPGANLATGEGAGFAPDEFMRGYAINFGSNTANRTVDLDCDLGAGTDVVVPAAPATSLTVPVTNTTSVDNNSTVYVISYTAVVLAAGMISNVGLGSFSAAQTVDANNATVGWETDAAAPGAQLKVDLGAAVAVQRVVVFTDATGYIGHYRVEFSDDDVTYTIAKSDFNPFSIGENETSWNSVGAHRFWRLFLFNTPAAGPDLTELSLFTAGATATVTDLNNNTFADGWNLLGNHFTAPIDWDAAGITRTNVDDAYYVFSSTAEYGGTFESYIAGVGSSASINQFIAPMQGFWVRCNNVGGAGSLEIDLSARSAVATPTFFKNTGIESDVLIRLSSGPVSSPDVKDFTTLYFKEFASEKFERHADAFKLRNTDENYPNLFTISDGNELSINALPLNFNKDVVIPLRNESDFDEDYHISVELMKNLPDGVSLFLEDHRRQISHNLTLENTYNFDQEQGLNNAVGYNRFFLRFTGTEYSELKGNIAHIYNFKNFLNVVYKGSDGKHATLDLFDIKGKLIRQFKVAPGSHTFDLGNLASGVILARLYNDQEEYTTKLMFTGRE